MIVWGTYDKKTAVSSRETLIAALLMFMTQVSAFSSKSPCRPLSPSSLPQELIEDCEQD